MGLDGVEIILEVEKAFGIELPDDAAGEMVTVGDLYDFVLVQTSHHRSTTRCLTAITFYSLRRAFRELGINGRIHPDTKLDELLPPSGRDRKLFWPRLNRLANLKIPHLCRPAWMVTYAAAFSILSAVFSFLYVFINTNSEWFAAAIGLVALIATGLTASVLTRPFATRPGRTWPNFRGLTESILATNYQAMAQQHDSRNATDIWVVLRMIIAEQLGVDPERVTRDANFVIDLGLS